MEGHVYQRTKLSHAWRTYSLKNSAAKAQATYLRALTSVSFSLALFCFLGGGESVDDERRNISVDAGGAMFRHLVEVSLALGPVDLDTGHLEM